MKLYRFSPIKNKAELFEAIKYIHLESYKLCKESLGHYLQNAGNMGVFCHYEDEYESLISIREAITEVSDNPNQKYFRLYNPIVIPAQKDIPETVYTQLYIRRPDPYRHHVGDLDFYLESEKYLELKKILMSGKKIKGARVFERSDLDMIELYDPDVDVLGYISTKQMTEKVRFKQSDITKL